MRLLDRYFRSTLIAALLGTAAFVAAPARAWPGFATTWKALYPNSKSELNANCALCHFTIYGGSSWNAYGWKIRQNWANGSNGLSLAQAIVNAEPPNSDHDPCHVSNRAEIDYNTQPGWTMGPYNTGYFSSGLTITGQMPPAGILGKVDPFLCRPSHHPNASGVGKFLMDSDGDGMPDFADGCPNDPQKFAPGACGCGIAETDSDGDGTADCMDGCPLDPMKVAPGACGCNVLDLDSDGDGSADCVDGCPSDPLKIAPGTCGCGVPDTANCS